MQTFLNRPTLYSGGGNSHRYYGESNILNLFNYRATISKKPVQPLQPKWRVYNDYCINARCSRLSLVMLTLQKYRDLVIPQHLGQSILEGIWRSSIRCLYAQSIRMYIETEPCPGSRIPEDQIHLFDANE